MTLRLFWITILLSIFSCDRGSSQNANPEEVLAKAKKSTPVSIHGRLHVANTQLVDNCGRPVQLSGISHFWHTWEGKEHWNGDVVEWLRDDWRVSVVRAPLACHPNVEGDYLTAPEASMKQLRDLIDGAIEMGVYVIVDFHAHKNYVDEAVEVLGSIAKVYGKHPNLIYAIWNEPVGSPDNPEAMWAEIKGYAAKVIPAIRTFAPDNIIVVPTPHYDQYPQVAARDMITAQDLGGLTTSHIMYDLHVYAGQHKEVIRARADSALALGLPIIMTEVGRVAVNWGPENPIDSVSFNTWMNWIDERGISFTKWSLSYRNEVSSSLLESASANGNWSASDLSPEGKWNREFFRKRGVQFYKNKRCKQMPYGDSKVE